MSIRFCVFSRNLLLALVRLSPSVFASLAAGCCNSPTGMPPQVIEGPVAGVRSEAQRVRVFESSFPLLDAKGQLQPGKLSTVEERMAFHKIRGMSIAVIRAGRVAWAKGYGVLQAGQSEKVDTDTVFSVGSVSKVGAAAIALRLVDAGRLDLDRNVNEYLTRWKVPDNPFTAHRPVTLRGILSHTAGLTVHGFDDYQPSQPLPTAVDTLEGRYPAKNKPVRVEYLPGSKTEYSGGGITIEQLVIEEVTGLAFNDAARKYLFEPLGMTRSTYENPLPPTHGNIAKAHGEKGESRALPRGYESMPEMAASGLWSTPSDCAKLVIALIGSYRGAPDAFLSPALAQQMMTAVMTDNGPAPNGLGPRVDGEGSHKRFHHSGGNDSYAAYMEGYLGTGNGVVMVINSAAGTDLYREAIQAVATAEGWGEDPMRPLT